MRCDMWTELLIRILHTSKTQLALFLFNFFKGEKQIRLFNDI